ncbi:MAG: ABC transporter substrate-binding protein [Caldilineales bacterium]
MGRAIRWQAVIAALGIVLLAAILTTTARQITVVDAPPKGGVYREAVVGVPRNINPLFSFANDLDRDLTGVIFQGLVALNERGEPIPALAESWEISADQSEYTFHLRRNSRWHDGAPITADDVIFTIGVLQSQDFAQTGQPASIYLSNLWSSVSAEKIDDATVRFKLQQPLASFLSETTIGILPEHLWKDVPVADMPQSMLNLEPVGAGPWRLSAMDALRARLEPNPYWPGKAPLLDGIEFHFYPDYASAFAAFQAGEVDGVSRILPQDLPAAQESDAMEVMSAPLANETLLFFNLTDPNVAFLAEKPVRQALWLALDVPSLLATAVNSQAIPANGPIMPGTWAYAAPDRPATDVQRAADLLTEAGWVDSNGDGVRDRGEQTLSFTLLGDDPLLLAALAEQWKAIGVWAKPQEVSLVSLAADHLSQRNFQAAVTHWQLAGDPDPYPIWHSTQIANGQNYTGWSNRRADEIMEEGRSTTDQGRRIQLYTEFQRIFADELPALPLYFDVYNYGVSDAVHDVSVGRLNEPWERFRTANQWYMLPTETQAGAS